MEVLGLDVKREHVCQKHSEGGRNILGGVGAEIARRVERGLAALSRVLYIHFDPSFRVDAVLLFAEDGSERAILRNGVCTFARTRPLTLTRHARFRFRRLSTSGHVGLRQSSLGPLQIVAQPPPAL